MNEFEYRQFFDHARTHWWFLGTRRIICDAVERAASRHAHPRVLDVGCGAGNVLETLGPRFDRFGIDRELSALRVCRTHLPAPLSRADATALPFADAAFDVVVATDLLEHVEDDAQALRECARVCRPGGTVVAVVPAFQILYGPHDIQLHHFRRYRRGNLRTRLETAGFAVQRTTYFNTALFPAIAAVRLLQRLLVRRAESHRIDYRTGSRGPLRAVLLGLLAAERWWLRRSNLPVGASLLAVGVRSTA